MTLRVLRLFWRLPAVVLLFLSGLVTVSAVFPWIGFARRDRIIAIWSGALLWICGVRLHIIEPCGRPEHRTLVASNPGAPQAGESAALIVCNHVSWLDIFVVLAHRPAHFVAKIEIAAWPLIGRLVRGAGTLFIERGRRHAVHQLNERIESMLNAGRPVAIFPEGTTSDGTRLLPFHANLLEPALRSAVPVLPLGLRYRNPDGSPSNVVEFTGRTTLVESMLRIFGSSRVIVEVRPLPAVQGSTRHALAQAARQSLAEGLQLPLDDTMPETLQRARSRA
jgi:1-acyl-sn-glycerol-3-phosphate acyltransferase